MSPPLLTPADQLLEMVRNVRGITHWVADAVNAVRSRVGSFQAFRREWKKSDEFRQKRRHRSASGNPSLPRNFQTSSCQVIGDVLYWTLPPKDVNSFDVKQRYLRDVDKVSGMKESMRQLRESVTAGLDLSVADGMTRMSSCDPIAIMERTHLHPDEAKTKRYRKHKRKVSIKTRILEIPSLPEREKDAAATRSTEVSSEPAASVTVGTQTEGSPRGMKVKTFWGTRKGENVITSTAASPGDAFLRAFSRAVARITPMHRRRIYSMTCAQIQKELGKKKRHEKNKPKKMTARIVASRSK